MLGQPNLRKSGEILLGILVDAASLRDVRCRRISNWLVSTRITAGLAWNTLWSGGLSLYEPGLLRTAEGAGFGYGSNNSLTGTQYFFNGLWIARDISRLQAPYKSS